MCDLICDVITCVCRFDTGTTNASNKIMFENQENRKYGNKRIFLHKSLSKRSFHIEFTAYKGELMLEEAMTAFTLSDAYRRFAG